MADNQEDYCGIGVIYNVSPKGLQVMKIAQDLPVVGVLQEGDIITSIKYGDKDAWLPTVREGQEVLNTRGDPREPVTFRFERHDEQHEVTLPRSTVQILRPRPGVEIVRKSDNPYACDMVAGLDEVLPPLTTPPINNASPERTV